MTNTRQRIPSRPPRPTLASITAILGKHQLRIEERLWQHVFEVACAARIASPADVLATAVKRLAAEYEQAVRLTLRASLRALFRWTPSERRVLHRQIREAKMDASILRGLIKRSFIRHTNKLAAHVHADCYQHINAITNSDPRIAFSHFVDSTLATGHIPSDRDFTRLASAIKSCEVATIALLGRLEPAP